jgi:hypothetical protein
MTSSEAEDGSLNSFIHYVLARRRNRLLCRSEVDRSELCRSITGSASDLSSGRRVPIQILAFAVDDHWLRLVIRSCHSELRRKQLQRVLAEDGRLRRQPLDSPGALCEIVQSVRLLTAGAQLAAVRHCHFAPVDQRLVRDPAEWFWSSHRVYLGLELAPGLARAPIANLLAGGQGGWPFAYRCLMCEAQEGDTSITLPCLDVPILPRADTAGDGAFFQALRLCGRDNDGAPEFEPLVDEVCRTTGCDPRAFRSAPASRRFRLERALLVERLTGSRKLMSIHELAIRLGCDRSWLYRTRAQCRVRYPDLFSLHEDVPRSNDNTSSETPTSAIEELISKVRDHKRNKDR